MQDNADAERIESQIDEIQNCITKTISLMEHQEQERREKELSVLTTALAQQLEAQQQEFVRTGVMPAERQATMKLLKDAYDECQNLLSNLGGNDNNKARGLDERTG